MAQPDECHSEHRGWEWGKGEENAGMVARRMDGHWASKITDNIALPTLSSQFQEVCVTLAVVTCVWSMQEMRQLKEGQIEAGTWFLRCSGPKLISYLVSRNQNGWVWSGAPGWQVWIGQNQNSSPNTEIPFGFT